MVPHELKKKIIMPTRQEKEERFMMVEILPDVQLAETKRV
jgi:hypothetical protein